jgi:hypothetical protein
MPFKTLQAFKLSSALLALAILGGCAATVVKPTDAPEAQISIPEATKALEVVLVPAPQLQTGDDWTAFREEWQTGLASASAQQNFQATLLKKEPDAVAASSVLARVKVNDYRYVSQAKRYSIGIFSGNAFMDLDVEFLAPPGKRLIGSRKFTTSSSAWQGVFSAMTPKQVEAVTAELVRDVASKVP